MYFCPLTLTASISTQNQSKADKYRSLYFSVSLFYFQPPPLLFLPSFALSLALFFFPFLSPLTKNSTSFYSFQVPLFPWIAFFSFPCQLIILGCASSSKSYPTLLTNQAQIFLPANFMLKFSLPHWLLLRTMPLYLKTSHQVKQGQN